VLLALDPWERDRLDHKLEDEATAWHLWRKGHQITRAKDRELRELEERGELPPIPKEGEEKNDG
jgi:hypothetical protein